MVVSASMLSKLNTLNSNLNGNQVKKGQLKVPYTTFYIPQLADKIDIRSDYMRWAHSDLNGPKVRIELFNSIKNFVLSGIQKMSPDHPTPNGIF